MPDSMRAFDPANAEMLCEDLSLARGIPPVLRDQARQQLYFLIKTAPERFPSWKSNRLKFVAPPGWRPMNPSVTSNERGIVMAVRCTNYIIDSCGPRQIEGTPNFSRTFLAGVNNETLLDKGSSEVFLPDAPEFRVDGAPPGFEDMRIFHWEGNQPLDKFSLWGVMTRCDQNEEGWPEQWLGRINPGSTTLDRLKKLKSPGKRRPEKNWIPFVDDGGALRFVYLCDPTTVITDESKVLIENYPRIDATHFRGSSQGIVFEGGMLALVHSVTMHKGWPKNMHRLVWFDSAFNLSCVTDAFLFPPCFSEDYLNGYQYGMGLCWHPDEKRLLMSYSVGDGSAWLAALDASDVTAKLRSV